MDYWQLSSWGKLKLTLSEGIRTWQFWAAPVFVVLIVAANIAATYGILMLNVVMPARVICWMITILGCISMFLSIKAFVKTFKETKRCKEKNEKPRMNWLLGVYGFGALVLLMTGILSWIFVGISDDLTPQQKAKFAHDVVVRLLD